MDYRFGFNGQQKDNNLKGIGNSLDFAYRIHDSRLGRFLSVDPLAKSYPWNSPFAFAENDVIRCIDLEGLEKVDVVTTSFAPFDQFGFDGFGYFEGDGEGRKFGRELNRYRTSGSVKLDLATNEYLSKKQGASISVYNRAIFSLSPFVSRSYSDESPSKTRVNSLNKQDNFLGVNFNVAGGNKAHISAPDIDANVSISFTKISGNKFRVAGLVYGDGFPANETYLKDESGNILMLGASGPNADKNIGPFIMLFGNNNRKMSSFDINVTFSKDKKSIIEAENNGKTYTPGDWNNKFEKLDSKSNVKTNE